MPEAPRYRKQEIIGRIAAFLYRIYSATFRYRFHGGDSKQLAEALAVLDRRQPEPGNCYVCAFWHQDELALLPCFGNRNIVAMVSDSKDGTIMASALESFGYLTTRGSSTRGGVKAFVASLRMIRKGYNFTAAVDGPRGPIYRTKEGIIKLSEKSGMPILPLRTWPEHFFTFWKAWNRAKLPLPFTRIHVVIGRPAMYSRLGTSISRCFRGHSKQRLWVCRGRGSSRARHSSAGISTSWGDGQPGISTSTFATAETGRTCLEISGTWTGSGRARDPSDSP